MWQYYLTKWNLLSQYLSSHRFQIPYDLRQLLRPANTMDVPCFPSWMCHKYNRKCKHCKKMTWNESLVDTHQTHVVIFQQTRRWHGMSLWQHPTKNAVIFQQTRRWHGISLWQPPTKHMLLLMVKDCPLMSDFIRKIISHTFVSNGSMRRIKCVRGGNCFIRCQQILRKVNVVWRWLKWHVLKTILD